MTIIRVTDDLIAGGRSRDLRRNAIALAIREHVREDVEVCLWGSWIYHDRGAAQVAPLGDWAYFGPCAIRAGLPWRLSGETVGVRLPYEAGWLWRQLWEEWPADPLEFPLSIPERFLRKRAA